MSRVEWYDNFDSMIQSAYLESKEIIMMCDLNIDLLKPSDIPNQWIEFMYTYQLTQRFWLVCLHQLDLCVV